MILIKDKLAKHFNKIRLLLFFNFLSTLNIFDELILHTES